MGHDQHQPPNSSGTLVAVIGAGLLLAILGIVVVAAIGLFWVRASTQQARAVAVQQEMVAEMQRSEAMNQLRKLQDSTPARPDPRLSFEIQVDRDGNASTRGDRIDLDELKAETAKLKDETSNAFTVRITAASECPIKHLVAVLDVLNEVGDIDYLVELSKESDDSADESGAGN